MFIKESIRIERRKYFELKNNKNVIYLSNLWTAANVALNGKL